MKLPDELDGKTPEQRYKEFKKEHEITPFKHDYEPPLPSWLIKGLFLTGGKLNFIVGESGAGKSRFLRWCFAHLLDGQNPLGLESTAVKKIVWAGSEEHYDSFFINLRRYGQLINADMTDWDKKQKLLTHNAHVRFLLQEVCQCPLLNTSLYELLRVLPNALTIPSPHLRWP